MYRKEQYTEKTLENFKNLFEGKLDEENRWIKMSKMIPWEEFEGEYAKNFVAFQHIQNVAAYLDQFLACVPNNRLKLNKFGS